jgi:hypothetical protein
MNHYYRELDPVETGSAYLERATARLALIEKLDARCQWDKHDCEVSFRTQQLRALRKRLMDEQSADEVAEGL